MNLTRESSPVVAVSPSRWIYSGLRDAAKDGVAGLVASVVLIANIISFGALMFPGSLSAGVPIAIWSMLIGSCIGGLWIASFTSLPPLATGIDSPTGAVLVLLSATTGSAVAAMGGSQTAAIQTIMLVFTAATMLSGGLLFALGALRWGSYFRFVPSSVVQGFLVATGFFLIAGAIRMTMGRSADLLSLASKATGMEIARLAAALTALIVLLAVRRWIKSPLGMPATLLTMWLGGVVLLRLLGLSGAGSGWYFPALGALSAWSPLLAARTSVLTWPLAAQLVPQLFAVAIVALISLVTKVSSLEIARQTSGDLNREFRAHGVGSLIAAPFGGLTSSLQTGTSRLLEYAGGATRMSGVVSALVLGAVGLSNYNLPGQIPIPIIAGLVLYLGYAFIVDALWRPFIQRAWVDLALAAGIALVCIQFGYLIGVLAGIVCACILFVISYARLGSVRRHASRSQFAGYVARSTDASDFLRKSGDAIQIYWLSGYIFFGSSEGVFERIRSDIRALPGGRVAYVILDFHVVSAADSSAIMSLVKLRNFCDEQRVTLVFSSLSAVNRRDLERGGFLGGKSRHQAFADLHVALAWCEDRLLTAANLDGIRDGAGFEAWIQRELGDAIKAADLIAYLDRKDAEGATILYRQGEPADTVDFVAMGNLAIDVATAEGESKRIRRLTTHTVVGEMGFFRQARRSATITSDGPATIYTLTRAAFQRMRSERPDLASAFDDFILRILADRVDFANRALAASDPA